MSKFRGQSSSSSLVTRAEQTRSAWEPSAPRSEPRQLRRLGEGSKPTGRAWVCRKELGTGDVLRRPGPALEGRAR